MTNECDFLLESSIQFQLHAYLVARSQSGPFIIRFNFTNIFIIYMGPYPHIACFGPIWYKGFKAVTECTALLVQFYLMTSECDFLLESSIQFQLHAYLVTRSQPGPFMIRFNFTNILIIYMGPYPHIACFDETSLGCLSWVRKLLIIIKCVIVVLRAISCHIALFYNAIRLNLVLSIYFNYLSLITLFTVPVKEARH